MDEIVFCNITFRGLQKTAIFAAANYGFTQVVTLCSDAIVKTNKEKRLFDIANANYTTIDGHLPYKIAQWKNPKVMIEKISGSDFIYDACQYAKDKQWRVFLLGGKESSNKKSVINIQSKYGIEIAGYSPPYKPYPFDSVTNQTIIDRIRDFEPHIIFIGFGIGKQEFWIDDNRQILEQMGIRLAIGSGGTFEMVAGELRRAPVYIQRMGLEGLYRILVEPKWFRLKRWFDGFEIIRYI